MVRLQKLKRKFANIFIVDGSSDNEVSDMSSAPAALSTCEAEIASRVEPRQQLSIVIRIMVSHKAVELSRNILSSIT